MGTPNNKSTNEANLKYIFQVVVNVKKNLNKYKVIVNKSTVPVTTGDKPQKVLNSKSNRH